MEVNDGKWEGRKGGGEIKREGKVSGKGEERKGRVGERKGGGEMTRERKVSVEKVKER